MSPLYDWMIIHLCLVTSENEVINRFRSCCTKKFVFACCSLSCPPETPFPQLYISLQLIVLTNCYCILNAINIAQNIHGIHNLIQDPKLPVREKFLNINIARIRKVLTRLLREITSIKPRKGRDFVLLIKYKSPILIGWSFNCFTALCQILLRIAMDLSRLLYEFYELSLGLQQPLLHSVAQLPFHKCFSLLRGSIFSPVKLLMRTWCHRLNPVSSRHIGFMRL